MERGRTLKFIDRDENDYLFFEGTFDDLQKLLPNWDGKLKMGDIIKINGIDKRIIEINFFEKDNESDEIVTVVFQDKNKPIYSK
ncbi:hypothetical protein HYI36_12910 [Bacillus sp. Gen3]|nr:hypothetical protein [Bacillus sp. Gen3]